MEKFIKHKKPTEIMKKNPIPLNIKNMENIDLIIKLFNQKKITLNIISK